MATLASLSKFCTYLAKPTIQTCFRVPKRNLNLLEYQSKKLLEESGVAIQNFRILEGKKDADVLKDFSTYCNILFAVTALDNKIELTGVYFD